MPPAASAPPRARLPSRLPGHRVKILDGNHLEATEHRLPELRTTWATPPPGKGLGASDQPTLTVIDVLPAEDGQAQERSSPPEVVPLIERGDLWLGGRNLCIVPSLFATADRHAGFTIRQHGARRGELLGARPAKGRCATGRVYAQRLRVRDRAGPVRVFRRVTVALDQPTKGGDTEVHLLTNLPAKKASARKVAELYRQRWTIGGLFLGVSQTLDGEIDTLCYPKAALFAWCLGLWAANAVALLKAALRAGHGRKVVQEQVSG